MKALRTKCPWCGREHDVPLAAYQAHLGAMSSPAKVKAARQNGKKGGRPPRPRAPEISLAQVDALFKKKAP